MASYLVISALGTDRPGIVQEISRAVLDSGCNIEDSRMTVLGGEFAVLMLISGNWNSIAKLEGMLPGLQEKLDLTVISKRTKPRPASDNLLPYAVEVVTMDHPGIVHEVANFFSGRRINIEDLYTDSYRAAHTGTPMFNMSMRINIPADLSISTLREEFMDFCDELNLDAVLEPVKGH
jgi:glycine cleavage system transcriptional repressor